MYVILIHFIISFSNLLELDPCRDILHSALGTWCLPAGPIPPNPRKLHPRFQDHIAADERTWQASSSTSSTSEDKCQSMILNSPSCIFLSCLKWVWEDQLTNHCMNVVKMFKAIDWKNRNKCNERLNKVTAFVPIAWKNICRAIE